MEDLLKEMEWIAPRYDWKHTTDNKNLSLFQVKNVTLV